MTKQKKLLISEYKNSGLTSIKAQEQLKKYGLNTVVGKKPPSDFYFLLKQFQNPLVLVLVIAIIFPTP